MKRILACVVLFSLSPTALLAQDNNAASAHSVQCLIAGSELIPNPDPNVRTAGFFMSMFFAGEVFGMNPDIDLPAAVKAEASKLTPDQIKALLVSCGAEMKARGKQISAAGAVLSGGSAAANPS